MFWRQFRFVVVKNLLVKTRHLSELLLEFIVPLVVIIGLWSIRLAVNERVTDEYIPDHRLHVSTLDELFQQPSCRQENLIWHCATFENTNCDVFDYETHTWEGCMMKRIAVAPASSSDTSQVKAAQDFIAYVNSSLELTQNVSLFTYFESESDFIRYVRQDGYSRDTANIPVYSSAVIFNSASPNWDYTIRLNKTSANAFGDFEDALYLPNTEEITNIFLKSATEWPINEGVYDSNPYMDSYVFNGLFSLTNYVNSFVSTEACRLQGMCSSSEDVDVRNIGMVHFPNVEIKEDSFWASVGSSFALLMILALLYPISNVIKSLVKEKESRLKEGMLMMSLESSVLAGAWIFHFFLIFCPLAVMLTFAGQGLFEYSDTIFIFLYFLCFFMASMAYSFLVSVLFSRAKSASIVGTFVYFMGYFIFIGLQGSDVSKSEMMFACLHPASAFTYGTLAFMEYEDAQIGVTSDTWTTSTEYPISFADTLLMQLINTLYLGFLTWYLGQVWRSEFGLAKPWYFLFLPSYWKSLCGVTASQPVLRGNGEKVHTEEDGVEMVASGEASKEGSVPVEDVTSNMRQQVLDNECVHLSGLTKVFDTNTGQKVAVDGLDMTFYSGQITALLGHNGAGKSTVVAMLSGLFPPSGGTASIAGYDIGTDMHEARKLLGVCPQHDVLLPELTVAEHLNFFAGIKGCPPEEIPGEIDRLLKSVGLTEKRNVQAKLLSGGQKRKLSVAIAFIGNSKIVILDEPTSGMDPYSRRFTWNVIRQHREGRVIILVTHFMDEADLLGDRIAIMGDGKLRCCGSSLFLKKRYGVGYNMTIEKNSAVGFDSSGVLKKIKQIVPDASIMTDVGTELTVQLPFASSQKFEELFAEIDASQQDLDMASYGMSVTTMEEVFLKVAAGTDTITTQSKGTGVKVRADSDGDQNMKEEGILSRRADIEANTILGEDNCEVIDENSNGKTVSYQKLSVNHEESLFWRHMRTLLRKRIVYFSRDTKSWLYQYVLPVVFVLLGAVLMYVRDFAPDQPSIVASPDMYNKKISVDDYPLPYASSVCYDQSYCPAYFYPHTDAITLMENIPDASNLPVEFVNVSNFADMSQYLLDHRENYKASRYGAVSFHEIYMNESSVNNGSISSVTYSVHANFSGVHSSPVTNQLVAQAVLRSLDEASSLTMRLHPLPETVKQDDMFNQWSLSDLVIFMALGISFVPAGMASFVVYEKETKSRHQQLVSGVSIHAYWLSTWVWDSLTYQLTAWMMLIVILAFPDTEPLTSSEAFPVTVGLVMLFGPAVSGFVYLMSYFLKTSATSQIVVIFLMFVLGLILGIVALVLRFISSTNELYLSIIRYCIVIVPPLATVEGLNNLALREQYSTLELGDGEMYEPDHMKIAGYNLIILGIESVLFISIRIAIDHLLLKPNLCDCILPKKPPPPPGTGRDEDVEEEDRGVSSGEINENNNNVLLKELTKVYSGGKYAVKGVSLGIPSGECFGLLGINGAGKSSLLNMLSGEFPPTSGNAFISGTSLVTDVNKCRKLIGFCPQFDALYDLLTGREHLELYAAVKGIPPSEMDEAVNTKLRELGLVEYADRATGGYSGGNKRKLSVAMAMIGDPSIIFLDEPSTGMDPMARRFMWKVISDVVTLRKQCSLILTTHSMEECEALCTRISIMVDGVMRCLGSSQRLRSKYGLGYQVEILLKVPKEDMVSELATKFLAGSENAESGEIPKGEVKKALGIVNFAEWFDRFTEDGSGADIHHSFEQNGCVTATHLASWVILEERFESLLRFLDTNFSGYMIRERQIAKVRVEVPFVSEDGSHRKLSRMFGLIEKSLEELHILEYSISQTSLEQIFNSFAMQQTGEIL